MKFPFHTAYTLNGQLELLVDNFLEKSCFQYPKVFDNTSLVIFLYLVRSLCYCDRDREQTFDRTNILEYCRPSSICLLFMVTCISLRVTTIFTIPNTKINNKTKTDVILETDQIDNINQKFQQTIQLPYLLWSFPLESESLENPLEQIGNRIKN